VKLGSLEYLQEIKHKSNADPKYLELAKGNNESYTLVLEPEPEQGVRQQIIIGFDNVDGRMNEVAWQRPTLFTLQRPTKSGWTS
jgi:hypothetical protein